MVGNFSLCEPLDSLPCPFLPIKLIDFANNAALHTGWYKKDRE